MDKRRVRRICRVLYGVAIAVKVVAIYAMVLSILCIVNGGRLGMLLPFAISVAVWIIADELLDATESRLK